MDTRLSNQVNKDDIYRWIGELSQDFYSLGLKIKKNIPEIILIENPKEILTKMIKAFGFNPKHFKVCFGKKTNQHIGGVIFKHGSPISFSNKVKFIFTIKNSKIENIKKRKEYIFTIAHELCHVLLLSDSHKLGRSELCTDLLALIIGFNVIHYPFNFVNGRSAFYGYITPDDLKWVHKEVAKKSEIIYLCKN